jgi:hypothetical protein
MKENHPKLSIHRTLSTLCLTAGLAMTASGASLSLFEIPTLSDDGANPFNEGRAITADGQYVVGIDGPGPIPQYPTRGFLYQVGTLNVTNVLSSDGAQSIVANGVGWRTSGGNSELIISGTSSGYVTEWMTPDGGTTFGAKRRNTSFAYNIQGPANQVGAALGSDLYYVASDNGTANQPLFMGQGAGAWVATVTYNNKGLSGVDNVGRMNGLGASGRAVGWRGASGGQGKNYILTWSGTGTPANKYLNGLAGDQYGQAYSVSADGNTVFGYGPKTVGNVGDWYGYKTTLSNAVPSINGTNQGAVYQLPNFADVANPNKTLAVPYGCTPEGNYAVGMNYRGMEKAVIWDTSSPDTNIWTVVDLTDLAAANGILGNFGLNLRRAYSAGTNSAGEIVITGYGVDNTVSPVAARAFVMTVAKWVAAIQFPISQTVNYGSNVTFSLKTNGTDSLTFQWYKAGTALPGETTTSLTLNNVSCAGGQAGNYAVVIQNVPISGVVTGAVTLTVLDPFITSQPLSRTNLAGTSANFTVAAGGAPTLSYSWERGGVPLSDGLTGWGSTVLGSSTPSLTISNLHVEDTDTSYRVVVRTSAGNCTATSRATTLKVVERPVITAITALGGDSYRLDISGPSGQANIVLYSTDISLPLGSWKPLVTNTLYGGGLDSYTDSNATNAQRFYILKAPYTLTP